MILDKDNSSVIFKVAPGYYEAIAAGKKTAEVRMMNSHETDDFRQAYPKYIVLTDLFGYHEMKFTITYRTPLSELLGTSIWMICFVKE
jgi:hypothetical protein